MTKSTRSDRSSGTYRAYRGSGPVGIMPLRSHRVMRDTIPLRGRGSGTPFVRSRRVKGAIARARAAEAKGNPAPPMPHPTKRGPGRA